ncbi:uncharacterized protein LOC141848458 [Curcuma longa]|uniref:uncharacterized protein LOC141848458 n=1 Tax=Curcuma longa TaxID=136217 RepID=UPI003D9F1CA1
MALQFRLRRAAAISSSLLKSRSPFPAISASSPSPLRLHASPSTSASSSLFLNLAFRPHARTQFLSFWSSSSLSNRRSDGGDEKFGPDEILFEGCDYNHWLITMDFPKDPAPTREEMIGTYIQTLAKVVGSVEEAKKRMYALSTTTYHGFQAVMPEEMSEKFHGLPGVVFVLPDSYIDPVNKEYGGDKYENGVITPRPPPIQYGRQGRPRNQNRTDRPNYNSPPPRGNNSFGQQGFGQGDQRNYAPPQTNNHMGQDGRGYAPHGGQDYAYSGERRDFGRGEQRNFAHQGEWRDPMPQYQQDFNQGTRGNFTEDQRNFSRGPGGDNRFSGPPGYNREYTQGMGPGYGDEYGRGGNSGYNGEYRQQGPGYGGPYRQESAPAHGQSQSAPGEGPTGEYGRGVNSGYNGEYKQQGPGYGGPYRQESTPAHGQSQSAPGEGPTGSWQGRT